MLIADDLAVQIICKKTALGNNLVNNNYNSAINNWCTANILCLNRDKTRSLEFRLRCYNENCDSVKCIGVFLKSNTKWNSNSEYVSKNISKDIFLLGEFKHIVTCI